MEAAQLTRLLEKNQHNEAIQYLITQLKEYKDEKTFALIRQAIALPDEEMRSLLQVLDWALMGRVSSILVKARYRRNKSISTTIWFGEELMDQGKYLEAWELFMSCWDEDLSEIEQDRLFRSLAIACMFMKRFEEAYNHMKSCEEVATQSMQIRWGYYYLQKGEWEQGISYLIEALEDPKEVIYAYGLLIRHHLLHGEWSIARTYLDSATTKGYVTPAMQMEWIRYFYKKKEWKEMREAIQVLQTIAPFHHYQFLIDLWTAESFYEEGNYSSLQSFLEENPNIRNLSYFKNFTLDRLCKRSIKQFKPTIQKSNYCVPASIEMALSMYGHSVSQEEVAEKVFSVSGSSLMEAIAFLEEQGYYSRYFYANIERIKQLLDAGAAVIMNVEYPTSSHVQLVVGYDDYVRCLLIQDPNLPDPYHLEYEKFTEEYANSQYLAFAIVPNRQKEVIQFLDPKEHQLVSKSQFLGEKGQSDIGKDEEKFIRQNIHHVIVATTYLKYLWKHDGKELLERAVNVVKESTLIDEYKHFTIAMAYIRLKEWKQAEESLSRLKSTAYQSSYYYWMGRIRYDQDNFAEAAELFYEGLLHESEDFVLWSYLAMSNYYLGEKNLALVYSTIAMDINELDTFVRINHGLILFDNGYVEGAREQFHLVVKENKTHGHAWFERAKCDMVLERFRHAERGFKTAIALDPSIPISYKELANLYEFIHSDKTKAEQVLINGIENTENSNHLLIELGDFHLRHKAFDQAREAFYCAMEKDSKDSNVFVSLGQLLLEEGKPNEAYQWLNEHYEQFQTDSEFLINGGRTMWNACSEMNADQRHMEQALDLVEHGIKQETSSIQSALEIYVNMVEDTPYNTRGVEFLRGLQKEDEKNYLYPSYIGCLLEYKGEFYQAIQSYESALSISEEILPLYRLGKTYASLGDNKKAKRYYKKVLELDSTHVDAMLCFADICERLNHKVQEVFYMKKAFSMNPYLVNIEYFVTLLKEEELHEIMDQLNLLENKTNQAFIHNSIAFIYGQLGDLDREEELVKSAMAIDKEDINYITHFIKILIKRDAFSEAKKLVNELIQKEVEDQNLYPLFVETYVKSNSMLSLEKEINRLHLDSSTKSLVSMYTAAAYEKILMERRENEEYDSTNKGWFGKLRKFGKATVDFGVLYSLYENAIKLDRNNISAVLALSGAYMQLELVTDAVKVLQKSLKLQWNEEVATTIAAIYIDYLTLFPEKKHPAYLQEAKRLLERCLAEERSIPTLISYGYLLRVQKDYTAAEETFLEIIESDSNNKWSYYHLGLIYRELNLGIREKEYMIKALEIDPIDSIILNEASVTYRFAGDYTKALELIDEALNTNPDALLLHYNRACYLSLLGKLDESAQLLIKIFEVDDEKEFIDLSMEDEDLLPLKKAGMFPLEWSGK